MRTACACVLDHAEMPRHGRDLGGGGEFLRLDLVAHRGDGARVGADEHDPGGGERLGKAARSDRKP